jgi:hypothetical protein
MDWVFLAQLLPGRMRIVVDEKPWVCEQVVNVHCGYPASLSVRS